MNSNSAFKHFFQVLHGAEYLARTTYKDVSLTQVVSARRTHRSAFSIRANYAHTFSAVIRNVFIFILSSPFQEP